MAAIFGCRQDGTPALSREAYQPLIKVFGVSQWPTPNEVFVTVAELVLCPPSSSTLTGYPCGNLGAALEAHL